MPKVIWMSDLHFAPDGDVLGHDPRQRLDAAVGYINRHHGDAECCVISGDLVDHATAEGYTALRAHLDRLRVPYLPMVGNHDDRTLMVESLPVPKDRLDGFVQYAVDLPGAVLLCLDTLIPGEGAGALCAARLDWVQAQLRARPDVPAYLFMHHPPVPLGLPAQDPIGLRNGAEFMAMLAQFPTVRHVFAGHVHRPCSAMVRGIGVTTARSVLMQAPAPWPAWDWGSFAPAPEAPSIGVIGIDGADMWQQQVEFCVAGFRVTGR